MTDPMLPYVFVVEAGYYEDRAVEGVYATLEAAMAAQGGTWVDRDDEWWQDNGSAVITRMPVKS